MDNKNKDILKWKPQNLAQLKYIKGIGNKFIEDNSYMFDEYFAENRVGKYEITDDKSQIEQLNGLKNSLFQFSRNRLLNYNKEFKTTLDLFLSFESNVDLINLGSLNINKMTFCSREDDQLINSYFSNVSRKIELSIRTEGRNDFWFGLHLSEIKFYSKVEQKEMELVSPLILVPIKLGKSGSKITKIELDVEREITLNSVLLNYYLFHQEDVLTKNIAFDENTNFDFESVLEIYNNYGLDLNDVSISNLDYDLISSYPLISSQVITDYNTILKNNFTTDIIDSLFGNNDNYSVSSGSFKQNDVYNISELSKSQEDIISLLDSNDIITLQGPPGTGKSHTISNIISTYIAKGKKVALLSEKRTALEVVFNKFKENNKYSILIDNDDKKKDAFYDGLKSILLDLESNGGVSLDYHNEVSSNIEKQFDFLDKINQSLPKDHKYISSFDYCDVDDSCEINWLIENESLLSTFTLDEIHQLNEFYLSHKELLVSYLEFLDNKPFESLININSKFDYKKFQKEFRELDEFVKNNSSFFKKIFKGKEITSRTNEFISSFFDAQINVDEIDFIDNDGVFEVKDFSNKNEQILSKMSPFINDGSIELENRFNLLVSHLISKVEIKNHFDNISRLYEDKMRNSSKIITTTMQNKVSELSEVPKLINEVNKILNQSRKPSLARFFYKYSNFFIETFNLFLCTPETICSYFPLKNDLFDLLIIDEGSQLLIENALPAIYRTKKILVSGDSKQLQPQKLFSKTNDVSLDEDVSKSILDLSAYRSKMVLLNYHYRSKFEELINFSNYAFYDGKINISPNTNYDATPIETHFVEDAVFAKHNVKEAHCVVDKYFELMKEDNTKTFAIITMNSNQEKLINDIIIQRVAENSEFATLYSEDISKISEGSYNGLLVKNVGNIQGEERDICLISYVYASDVSGKIVRQFGDLSQENGEYKLNVAITRAKEKIYLFHSIMPEVWGDFETSINPGPRLLVKYLSYAIAISNKDYDKAKAILKTLSSTPTGDKDYLHFDSIFEEEVYEFLKGATNYEVHSQVGVSGYKIDLGILYKDRYILGIELDGAAYHSSNDARERDYYRQKYLENRGWDIYRIWSTEYFKDRTGEIDKLKKYINEAISQIDLEID